MRAPRFWSNPPGSPGWQAHVLTPATQVWRLAGRWRGCGVPYRAPVPVICIGNLTAGGAGKTPMVAALLARILAGQIAGARDPHVISRGYGGRLGRVGAHRVDPDRDSHRDVGDEPLLLAALAPVWVARDRAAAARAAVAAGAGVILMDDGFQNPQVIKDRTILMVDAVAGFGNGRLIPAGPLREPVAGGVARSDVVVLVGSEAERRAAVEHWPVLGEAVSARLVARQTGLSLNGEKVLAFAGIGRPGKFFSTLKTMGAQIVGQEAFADHCDYPMAVLNRLQRRARAEGAMLVTTEKDAVRLPERFRREVVVVQVYLEPADWTAID